MRRFTIETEQDMLALGRRIAEMLNKRGFVALYGDLGAGKTVFARGVAEAFGIGHVSSPTFTIVCEYPTAPKLFHFDAYRLSDADELFAVGFSDYLKEDALILMEWANLVSEALPKERLDVTIEGSGSDARAVTIEPRGARYGEVFHEDSCV
ncbi:MAG: tRNA (adenosine(37)-N6)-threonylcarbamoyltransferase complex ATPase subunit type 1 TsaE [Clostridia bacterium]|nr:tRNA (adenosine(37)-N6)-threonylcarbamoyltransferase complex ATPase subunit type 1 TsaE [Clostridia bacterium]